jgi:hypothetical protein
MGWFNGWFHFCTSHTEWGPLEKTAVAGYNSDCRPLCVVMRRFRQEGRCSVCKKIFIRYVDKKIDPPEEV